MKYILTVLSFLTIHFSFSQQEPQFTMFWNNYSMFNPANTGLNYKHYGGVLYRSQWDKVEKAPNSITALYEAKLDSVNSGVGVGYLRDVIGLGTDDRFYLNYAYHLVLKNGELSVGTSLFIGQIGFRPNWITPDGPIGMDQNLPLGAKDTRLNINFGLIYKRKKLKVGLSSTQINQAYYDDVNFKSTRHYFANATYNLELSKQFDLTPRFLFKTDGVAGVWEINVTTTFKNKYWAGVTYRFRDAVAFQIGSDFKDKFRVGYSYDLMTGPLSAYGKGSHEMVLAFILK